MRHTIALFGAAWAGIATWAPSALAQGDNTASPPPPPQAYYNPPPPQPAKEERYVYQALPAPTNAFELKLNAGYTQGFGVAAPNMGMPSVAGAGVNGTVDLDYRASPWASVGIEGEYQEFTSENNTAARGLVGNVGVTGHIAPTMRGDPYIRFGVGYRHLWSVDPPGAATTAYMGLELGRLTLGYDLRLSEGIAIAPQIGADLTMFLWDYSNGSAAATGEATIATFIYAGLNVRFDMGGSTTDSTTVAAK